MQRYTNFVADDTGKPLANGRVEIFNFPSMTQATIYATNDTSNKIISPLFTDKDGKFSFYAADGHYHIHITSPQGKVTEIEDVLMVDPFIPDIPQVVIPEDFDKIYILDDSTGLAARVTLQGLTGYLNKFYANVANFFSPLNLQIGTAYVVDSNNPSGMPDYTIKNGSAGTMVLTLPMGLNFAGRVLYVNTELKAVVSNSPNVTPINGPQGTAILQPKKGAWAMLQLDSTGTNWNIIANN